MTWDFRFEISNFRWIAAPALLGLAICPLAAAAQTAGNPGAGRPTVILVVGAAGEPEFGSNFVRQAGLWRKACAAANCRVVEIGLPAGGGTNDAEQLRQTLAAEPPDGLDPLWLVLIGHGTFDGRQARFNLRGPDVSATHLAEWLQPIRRPVAIVDTSSASAPFIQPLGGTNRVVITATRSGHEINFARFGQCLAEAIAGPQADLDKDGAVSLLEMYLLAARDVTEWYQVQGRIVTEHALLDDNGDGRGTPADWFEGVRAVRKPEGGAMVDGLLAGQWQLVPAEGERQFTPGQRAARDGLERAVLLHRENKGRLPEEDYYGQLEALLLPLAEFYETNSTAPR